MQSHRLGSIRRVVFCLSFVALAAGPLRAQASFRRGDADGSGGIEVTDAIRILHFLFLGKESAIRCRDAADADDEAGLVIGDALFLLNGLFLGGPAPRPPFPGCGVDPTADDLDCASHEACTPSVVQFFGFEFEADGLFFVVDRSGSMQDSGELVRAKQEIVTTISSLTEDHEIAVFFFDRSLIRWPVDGPARATEENKTAGIAFVQSIPGGSATCPEPALLRAVEYAARASTSARAIFYVSDGDATCGSDSEEQEMRQTIDSVTAANNGAARVHSILLNESSELGEAYMRELAEKNGGTFHHLDL